MKAIFLDRDGVINKDYVDYAYTKERFIILDKVPEALRKLKDAGYLLIIITNQSGIGRGIYTKDAVYMCHEILQQACGNLIDDLYFAPIHRSVSASLASKPGSLMIERAVAKYNIDLSQSWMVGDAGRDIEAAKKAGVGKTIHITGKEDGIVADYATDSLYAATKIILGEE